MRQVTLPDTIPGHLYLHATPGVREPLEVFLTAAARKDIGRVVCLNTRADIRKVSPDYDHLLSGQTPWEHVHHPVPDFGVPADPEAFRALAKETATALRGGKNVLIHCGAGIGRTGTFAIAVLLALGMTLPNASEAVTATGSGPQTDDQRALLDRLANSK